MRYAFTYRTFGGRKKVKAKTLLGQKAFGVQDGYFLVVFKEGKRYTEQQ